MGSSAVFAGLIQPHFTCHTAAAGSPVSPRLCRPDEKFIVCCRLILSPSHITCISSCIYCLLFFCVVSVAALFLSFLPPLLLLLKTANAASPSDLENGSLRLSDTIRWIRKWSVNHILFFKRKKIKSWERERDLDIKTQKYIGSILTFNPGRFLTVKHLKNVHNGSDTQKKKKKR